MTSASLGARFVRWGLGLFIFGLVIGYGPLLHYLHGAMEEVQPAFLKNVTLWWACPWTLSTYMTQVGALGMVVVGLCHIVLDRGGGERASSVAFWLCVIGIVAEFVLGYLGYFAINHVWPNFYFTPIQAGKNLWLGLQGASIALYLAGIVVAYRAVSRRLQVLSGA